MAKITARAKPNKVLDPEKDYRLRIIDYELKTSKAGNDYLNFRLSVEAPTEFEGQSIWYMGHLSAKASFTMTNLLDHVNAEYEVSDPDENGESTIEFDTDDVVGRLVFAKIKNKEFNQKMQSEIAKFLAPDEDDDDE